MTPRGLVCEPIRIFNNLSKREDGGTNRAWMQSGVDECAKQADRGVGCGPGGPPHLGFTSLGDCRSRAE
jgi:hypothetical protein